MKYDPIVWAATKAAAQEWVLPGMGMPKPVAVISCARASRKKTHRLSRSSDGKR